MQLAMQDDEVFSPLYVLLDYSPALVQPKQPCGNFWDLTIHSSTTKNLSSIHCAAAPAKSFSEGSFMAVL